ncbi:hypothetical protein BH20GEM1_BH20GEM1_13860 [soil metagenome]
MRPLSRHSCRRLASLRWRACAFLLHWIALGAAIDEGYQAAALDERELTALSEAIDRARRAGR